MRRVAIVLLVLMSLVGCGNSGKEEDKSTEKEETKTESVKNELPKKYAKLAKTVHNDLSDEKGYKSERNMAFIYRGYVTEMEKAGDKGYYMVIKQMEDGFDYGTPEFLTYAPKSGFSGEVDFQVGDYVESKYEMISEGSTDMKFGLEFPTMIMNQLIKAKEDVNDGGRYIGTGTVVSATYDREARSPYFYSIKDNKTNEVIEMYGSYQRIDFLLDPSEKESPILKEGDVVDFIYAKSSDKEINTFELIIKHE